MSGAFDAIIDLFAGRYKRMAATRARIAGLYAIAGLFVIITLVALLIAASIALADVVGAFVASLLVALFSCLIALVLLIIASSRTRAAAEREAREAAEQRRAVGMLMVALPMFKSRNAILLAVAAGVLVGVLTGGSDKKDPPA